MANIKNNNYRKIDCRLYYDTYMDFMISKDEALNFNLNDDCIAAKLNFFNHNSNNVISEVSWINSISSDTKLNNIGYTGVDNGFISYEKDRIGNDEFLELFTNSTFDLSKFGDKFFVTKVDGNTNLFSYPIEINNEYTSLKGGFYQGFFKIDGDKYQTLPHRIDSEWNFTFTLRAMDYETPANILNKRHFNNEGIFFFIGTRAENKFWELYKSDEKMNEYKYDDSEDYTTDFDLMDSDVVESEYHDNGFFEDDYLKEQISLNDIKLKDSKNNPIGEKGFYEIETDNKFIIFNHGKEGYTTKTWDENYKFVLTGKNDSPNINYYPYLNHGDGGYTKKNVEELNDKHSYKYDVLKDIDNNAFALKINQDGSISYRLLTDNAELIEETSMPNIIKKNEWAKIQLKMVRVSTGNDDVCDENYVPGKMRIYVYVNGLLKIVSKELPELFLKPLNDSPERQEGVPYTISIGGGTQGLSERIFLDYYDMTNYILPMEKYFGGTFIGDIKDFTFVPCITIFDEK